MSGRAVKQILRQELEASLHNQTLGDLASGVY